MIKYVCHFILSNRARQTITSYNLVEAINTNYEHIGNGRIDDVDEFLDPWIGNNGCPLIHVGLRQGGVLVTQVTNFFYDIIIIIIIYINMSKAHIKA